MVHVNYKKAGVWILQYGKMVDATKDAEGKSTQEKVFQGGTLKIGPGLNKIEDSIWDEINDNPKYPDVSAAIAEGILTVIEQPTKKGEKKKDTIETLTVFSLKQAIEIVDGQMNEDELTSWKKDEKRPQVLKAINDQLKKLKAAEKAMEKGRE